jgi:lactoylglutathione lyase
VSTRPAKNTIDPGRGVLNAVLILADLDAHGYHAEDRERAVRTGPLGSGFVLSIPTENLDTSYALWRDEALPITLEPEDAGWARIFYGLDPDGYEVMFEQFHG